MPGKADWQKDWENTLLEYTNISEGSWVKDIQTVIKLESQHGWADIKAASQIKIAQKIKMNCKQVFKNPGYEQHDKETVGPLRDKSDIVVTDEIKLQGGWRLCQFFKQWKLKVIPWERYLSDGEVLYSLFWLPQGKRTLDNGAWL